MKELFEAAFSAVNIIPTALLLLILVYWLSVIIGALDMDFLNVEVDPGDVDLDVDADVDVDADLDVEADADVDADADADAGTSTSGALLSMNSILSFFNLGKVPFMLLMSFLILSIWVISILVNYTFGIDSFLIAFILLLPNIVLSLFVAKFLTTPFAILYTRMAKSNDEGFTYEGKICKVLMSTTDSRIGQAQIEHNGSTYRINILAREGESLTKSDTGLVINYITEKKCYLVEPYKY